MMNISFSRIQWEYNHQNEQNFEKKVSIRGLKDLDFTVMQRYRARKYDIKY